MVDGTVSPPRNGRTRSARALDRRHHVVDAAPERIKADLEVVAIEVGQPAGEVLTDGTMSQQRRHETDANPAPDHGPGGDRPSPRGIAAIESARTERSVARLQRTVVLALIGEEKIAPDQSVGDLVPVETGDPAVEFSLERFEAMHISCASMGDIGNVLVDHRQREVHRQRGAKIAWVLPQRVCITP